MRWYREFIAQAPDDLNGFFAFLIVPPGPPFPEHLHNKKMCGVVWCYTGSAGAGRGGVRSRSARSSPPALDFVGPIPHPALQSMFDALYPPGLQWYWKADFVNELSDEAIDDLHRARPTPADAAIDHAPLSDRTARRGAWAQDDTAWSYRDATWAEVIVGVDPDPANKERIDRLGQGLLGGRCIPTRPAART